MAGADPVSPSNVKTAGTLVLLAGSMSEKVGAPLTLALGGACCVGGAIWFATTRAAIDKDIAPIFARI